MQRINTMKSCHESALELASFPCTASASMCVYISVEQATFWGGSNLLPSLSRATRDIGSTPG